jgi:hypothetical protein
LSAEDYEVRFFNADGTLSLVLLTNSIDDEHAREAALKMFATELKPFEIWRGLTLIAKGPLPSETQ